MYSSGVNMSTIAQHKLSCLCFIEPFPLHYTSLTARRRTPEVIKMDRFRILSQTWFGCNFDTSYAPEHFCRSNTISHEKMNFQEDRAAGKSWSTAHNADPFLKLCRSIWRPAGCSGSGQIHAGPILQPAGTPLHSTWSNSEHTRIFYPEDQISAIQAQMLRVLTVY